jgi:hypothetical protein
LNVLKMMSQARKVVGVPLCRPRANLSRHPHLRIPSRVLQNSWSLINVGMVPTLILV